MRKMLTNHQKVTKPGRVGSEQQEASKADTACNLSYNWPLREGHLPGAYLIDDLVGEEAKNRSKPTTRAILRCSRRGRAR